ncbi:protein ASPARTIC PROTEASE IN GUARD CELL 2-like [Chenopodium quinoa]|uniref:protein ASPARTIC PROTEASE IN GUARD CELL 2-like n=1 Tax=Chenopodium quinoa TaxID=63459 RepID=UPI000B789295|nr:protein ASPARTIC PROTEASE IN GUARD CELL 2-like [Chenopodium quinoa]
MYMGDPLQIVYGLFDTGSSLSWFKCNQPIERLEGYDYFNQTQSASYRIISCTDEQRCDIEKGYPYIKGCDDDTQGCKFDITYEDEDWTTGHLSTDHTTFRIGYFMTLAQFRFGCSYLDTTKLPGIIDDPKFSYCISSDLSQINVVLFGPEARIQGQPVKMLRNTNSDFYYIEVLAIGVNNERLDVPPSVFQMSKSGTRGFIIDSGTASTWLTSEAYDTMMKKMVQLFGPPVQYTINGTQQFEICYESGKFVDGRPPVIGFEFENYLLEIKESNMWYKIPSSTLQCLSILNGQNDTISMLGSNQLLDVNVGHDPNKGLLYFDDTIKCPNPFVFLK